MIQGFIKQKCPKCGGNICISTDYCLNEGLTSWYEQASCLQCGWTIYEPGKSARPVSRERPWLRNAYRRIAR